MSVAGWMYFTHQTEWKAYLQDLVSQNDVALLKSIVLIDNFQTEQEHKVGESVEDNSVGWTKHDAKEMGDIAVKVRKGEQLTEGEWSKSRNKMKKYWKQLMEISKQQVENGRQQQAVAKVIEPIVQEQLEKEQFRRYSKVLQECSENGKACEYGICDECPVTQGLQMRLPI